MSRSYQHFLAAIDPTVRRLSRRLPERLYAGEAYTAYGIDLAEYVGTDQFHGTDEQLLAVIDTIREAGYRRHRFVRAAKFHPDAHRAVDHGSFRRIPTEHPPAAEDTPLEAYDPLRCQHHTHLWPNRDGVERFSHYELRGDIVPVADESPSEALERMGEHYSPTYGETYLQGVRDPEL